jgi:hypothetical protein
MMSSRALLEAELEQLVHVVADANNNPLERRRAADELQRRVKYLAGARAEILVPVPGRVAAIPLGAPSPVAATVTIGPDDIAALRHALTGIVADAEQLRRIACAGTPAQAEAARVIPTVADRLPSIWLEIL